MEVLEDVVSKHKFKGSFRRVNVASDAPTVIYNHTTYLQKRILSDSLTKGPVFDACRASLPDIDFTHVQLNKNLACTPHRDGMNKGESWICFLGEFEGGELRFEGGDVFNRTHEWYKFDPQALHWNEPITSGTKYSVVVHKRAQVPNISRRAATRKRVTT